MTFSLNMLIMSCAQGCWEVSGSRRARRRYGLTKVGDCAFCSSFLFDILIVLGGIIGGSLCLVGVIKLSAAFFFIPSGIVLFLDSGSIVWFNVSEEGLKAPKEPKGTIQLNTNRA